MYTRVLILLILMSLYALPALTKVVIPGTGDSESLLQVLADDFQRSAGIEVEVPISVGSSGGIKLVANGAAVLGRVARPLKVREAQQQLGYRIFAYSPVVFSANLPSACLTNLTSQQLISIYNGSVTDWSTLSNSCLAGKIYVAKREKGDSSRSVIEKWLPELAKNEGSVGQTIFSTPALIQTVEAYPQTIGYAPLAMVDPQKLQVFSLDGVAPSAENIRHGVYRLSLPFAVVWQGELRGEEKQFFDYLFSDAAQLKIQQLGLVPIR